MPDQDFKYDVFLSHASEDAAWCENLAERLRNEGVHVWFDKWELKPGDHLLARLNEGLRQSRKMVAVWSASYFRDDRFWTLAEAFSQQYSDMLASERPLIPVLVEDCKIPPTLRNILFIDFRHPDDFDLHFHQLMKQLIAENPQETQQEQPTPGEGRQIYPSTGGTRWLSWGVVGFSVIMLGIGVLWYFLPYKKSILVPVPAGTFWMGCDVQTDSQCEDDEKPGVEVGVAAFSIDRYEVTVTEYRRCVQAGRCSTDGFTEYKGCNWGKTGRDNHPINCVNWYQAEAYCHWANKRLPTEAEWEKAARGKDKRKYPWGNIWDAKQANTSEIKIGETAPVNSYSSGASPYGVYNMIGNVAEWVQDWYDKGSYAHRVTNQDPRGPNSGYDKVLRGGSWQSSIQLRTSDRDKANPAYRHASIGFRCALEEEVRAP
jgi:sulfatase modifying factor 1